MDDLVFLMVKWFLGSDMRYSVTDVTDALYFIFSIFIIVIFYIRMLNVLCLCISLSLFIY